MDGGRSNRLVLLGVAVFVVGAGLVLAGFKAMDDDAPAAKAPPVRAAGGPAVPAQKIPLNASVAKLIPEGTEAVSVTLKGAAGVAGYPKPSDLVNVYATVKSAPRDMDPPFARLVTAGARVVDVKAPPPGTVGDATFLLAVGRRDAERIIFFARFESLWFTLARPDQTGKADTPGRGYPNAF